MKTCKKTSHKCTLRFYCNGYNSDTSTIDHLLSVCSSSCGTVLFFY